MSEEHEVTQEGRYGKAFYRGYEMVPDIDKDGEIDGYHIFHQSTFPVQRKLIAYVGTLSEGVDRIDQIFGKEDEEVPKEQEETL